METEAIDGVGAEIPHSGGGGIGCLGGGDSGAHCGLHRGVGLAGVVPREVDRQAARSTILWWTSRRARAAARSSIGGHPRKHPTRAPERGGGTTAFAAFELMVERGYAATTMTAIADHAGVAERTVYNLFGSKTGLMLATIRDRGMGGASKSLLADHQHMRSLEDPIEIIQFAVETNYRVASRAIPLFQVAYQAAGADPEVARALTELEEVRFQHQGEVVDVLKEKGFLRSDIPYELLKRGFWLVAGRKSSSRR